MSSMIPLAGLSGVIEDMGTCLGEGAASPQLGEMLDHHPSSLGRIPVAAATLKGCQCPPGPLWL